MIYCRIQGYLFHHFPGSSDTQNLVEEIVVIDSQHGQPLQFGELCYNHSIRVPCTSSKAFARGTCITNTLVNGRGMGCLPVLRIVSIALSHLAVSLARLHRSSPHPILSGLSLTSTLGLHCPSSTQGPCLVRNQSWSLQFSIVCTPQTFRAPRLR